MKVDYEVRQLQKENLKLEKKNQELEIKILDNEKVFRTEVMKTTDKEQKSYKELKLESESQIKELKMKLRSMQIELDVEKNQMSAQEEMLQSLIHNLSKEFIDFRAKNAPISKKKG